MQRVANSLSTLIALVALMLFTQSSRATILVYDIDNFPSGTKATNADMVTNFPGFGDFVNSTTTVVGAFRYNYAMGNGFTPNVDITMSVVAPATQQQFYSDTETPTVLQWKDVNFLIGTGGALFRTTFTPNLSTFGVQINSFDVFGYATSLSHTLSWTLRKDNPAGAIIASSGGVITLTTQNQVSPFTVITGAAPYFGTVVLEINHLTGGGGAFGMDNLNFDQVTVPEPSTLVLLGLGLIGMARRRRKGSVKSEV